MLLKVFHVLPNIYKNKAKCCVSLHNIVWVVLLIKFPPAFYFCAYDLFNLGCMNITALMLSQT